ncbi:MAG TPA: bifunctional rhamnulose-1-phosphate aldolase/short-chain dehydrogenase, partial [Dongiaceae bacterium]|nr:bifunctional rhamnulose-1-phosphate aldolase/short-chain dehydrogenase [Dongiaceae bacterium]
MADLAEIQLLENRWDEAQAATLDEPGRLLYRSHLLGADMRITNYGGGNTSAKVKQRDPLTAKDVEVLWVKGSGGDVGTMKLDGFATLYMEKLQHLKSIYRGEAQEDEMVGYLPHCTFNLNPRAASIDTPLHAFIPYAHVDHMHPDAVIAIAAMRNSKTITQKIFGDEIGWLPWRRPGFQLGLDLERFVKEHPKAKGAVLGGHGLITWGNSARECYEVTLRAINRAVRWFAEETRGKQGFGGPAHQALSQADRRRIAGQLMVEIRGRIGGNEKKVGHFDDQAAVLEFVNSRDLPKLAAMGTSCPDHFLRTKIAPLVVPFDPVSKNLDTAVSGLDKAIAAYRADYAAYYDRCKHADSPAMRDPNAVVYLVPGIGMITFARDKATARIAGEFYVNAINVMRGAALVDSYVGLPEQEAFDIEYWLLEEAKLQRMPKPKSLAGRIALVTGGAGGIGRAIASKLMSEGACVVLADIDAAALKETEANFAKSFGKDQVRTA